MMSLSDIKAKSNKVNWEIFNIDPWDTGIDLSKKQIIREYNKFNGSPTDFLLILVKDYGWSGMMCQTVEGWILKK